MLPLLLAACSAAPTSDPRQAAPVVQLPPRLPEAVGQVALDKPIEPRDVPDAPCVNGPSGLRCDGLVGEDELRDLPQAISAARKTAIVDRQFKDVLALVQLARLYLRRDQDGSDADGSNDAARAVRFARTSLAVDDTSPEARLILALTLVRSLQGALASVDPAIHEGALSLVENSLHAVPPSPKTRGAVEALEGYLALERGERGRAEAAFKSATQLQPDLGTAWAGLGDLARSEGDFAVAEAAYERAAVRLPHDLGLARARRAASHTERLALHAVPASPRAAIAAGPLAPAPPPPPQCVPSQAAVTVGASLCKGLTRLANAATPADNEKGALLVLEGWRELQPLCEAKDPACGPDVLPAMAAASRAFKAAGYLAKSIAVAKIILDPRVSAGAALTSELSLELGDRFFDMGMFDEAANWYARHAHGARAPSAAAAERVRQLRAVLEAAPAGPASGSGAPVVCAAPLACAVKRLAGEAW